MQGSGFQIYLHTDKDIYTAGETLTGSVHLSFPQEFPGNQLVLQLKGFEASYIVSNRYE